MDLLIFSISPIVIILFYIYFRDKYEKEPLGLLIKSLFFGGLIVIPVVFVEKILTAMMPPLTQIAGVGYSAFIVAGLTEEGFKFLVLYYLIWRNPNFNEKFDGIVYAVFISLGFATVENVLYVFEGGSNVAITRAITAVPAHALFGIRMGYFFGIAHMYDELRKVYLWKAFLIPFVLHGIYDFIIMSRIPVFMLIFIPYLIYLYYSGFSEMRIISNASVFRDDEEIET